MLIKIAIIDDKLSNRNILKDKLQRHGHFEIVLTAEDGKDFIDKMKALPAEQLPDVALMDLEMPNMDGVDAIALGSSFFPSVKFVVLTIFDDEEKILKAIKAGAFGYLLKDENAENISKYVKNAGSVFLGNLSPESAGDYASGTNHSLPTNGFAKTYSGVSVDSFVKKITFQKINSKGIRNIGFAVETMAAAEGLGAHKNAVSIRLKKLKDGKI